MQSPNQRNHILPMDIEDLHEEIDKAFSMLSYPMAVTAWYEIREVIKSLTAPSVLQQSRPLVRESRQQYEEERSQVS